MPKSVLPLAVSLGITLGALLVFRALTRSWPSAALMSTLLVVLFFTYGMAWDWIGKMLLGHWVLVSAWALVAVIGVSMIWRFEGLARRVAMPLNVIAALLVGFNLLLIAAFSLGVRPGVVVTGPGLTMSPAPSPGQELPDVYWIILDRYGSGNVLDKYYDYDNSPFLDELRARGFYVAEHATANYLVTALSMDSSRSMDYLDFASLRERATADHDWGPVYADLSAPFQVEHYLRSAGYRFLYLGSTWGPTARHPSAEINYVYDQLASEFLGVLEQSTILRAFEGLGAEAPFDRGRNRWNQIRYEWAGLNLHPRPTLSLDPHHHLVRLAGRVEMFGHQLVQHADPGQTLQQPSADQEPARVVLDLDVMMGLGPVVSDEQHPQPPSTRTTTRREPGEDLLRPNGSVLTGTTSHQHSRPPHQPPGHDLVIDLNRARRLQCSPATGSDNSIHHRRRDCCSPIRSFAWSGRRESNPHSQLGKLMFCH